MSNPSLNSKTFKEFRRGVYTESESMTVTGTIAKTLLLLMFTVGAALWTWKAYFSGNVESAGTLALVGALGGFVVGMITVFNKQWSPVLAPIYAVLEGMAVGVISAMYSFKYAGIAIQAAGLTFGVLFIMLMLYLTGILRPSEQFKAGIVAATGAIALVYLVDLGLNMFGYSVPYIHEGGIIGIIVSVVVVCVAALNLLIDFDVIQDGARYGAPKYMEWYGGFGLLVTIVWLYLEILRLLGKSKK